ncbi:MAG: 3-hydroxyacyl-CoA dehydrogenase family protein, partial [Calditrichota bacterium]
IVHFLNPPRYRELVELIQADQTLPEVIELVEELCRERLGKQVLFATDTPYFIANRVGVFAIMSGIKTADKMNFPVPLADAVSGAALGRNDAAIFSMADSIGLDTLALMALNISGINDRDSESLQIPSYLQMMISRELCGEKNGKGFYRYTDNGKEVFNRKQQDYEPYVAPSSLALQLASEYHTTAGKISEIIDYPDESGAFAWRWLSDIFLYAARCIPEVSRDILTIDRAMKWGFGWEMGPFELWNAIGVDKVVEKMRAEKRDIPEWVEAMLEVECDAFYAIKNGHAYYFDTHYGEIQPIDEPEDILHLPLLKEQCNIISDNWGASLVDIGEGVLCVEFHSIAPIGVNPIDSATLDILEDGLELLEHGSYIGMVLANDSRDFSNGINLPSLIRLIESKRWNLLESRSKRYQDIAQAIRYCRSPIVAAPHHYTTFQGLELALACDKRTAFSELYCGFTDMQLGLLPFGSGILQILRNFYWRLQSNSPGPFPPVRKAFDWFWKGTMSRSAEEALDNGLLQRSDRIILNRRRLLSSARNLVVEIAQTYQPHDPTVEYILPGEPGRLVLLDEINRAVQLEQIDPHSGMLAEKLAYILCGGNAAGTLNPISEQNLLDLEREVFLQLCGEPETLRLLKDILLTGNPPRYNNQRQTTARHQPKH